VEDRARIEERWRDDSLAGCRRGTRIFGLLIIALFALSAVYSAFAEPELFVTLLRIRLAAAAAVATVVGLVGTPWGERRSRELALVMMFVVAVALHALALETGGQASRQYDRMSFLVLGPSVLMLWDGWWSLTSSATVIGVYLAGSLLSGALGGAEFVANLGRLAAAATGHAIDSARAPS